MGLLRRWKTGQKLLMILAVMAVPLLALVYLFLAQANTNMRAARNEIDGLEYVQPVLGMIQRVQQHDALAAGFLAGDASQRDPMYRLQAPIDDDMQRIDSLDGQFGQRFGTTNAWQAARENWSFLKQNIVNLSELESRQRHQDLISSLQTLLLVAGDGSSLSLDPDLDSSYLINALLVQIPAATESIGQLRSAGSVAVGGDSLSLDERTQITLLMGRIRSNMTELERGVRTGFDANPNLLAALQERLDATTGGLTDYLDTTVASRALRANGPSISPDEFFDASTANIDALFLLAEDSRGQLANLLNDRISELASTRNLQLGVAALAILLAISLAFLINRSITSQIDNINNLFAQIGVGDFEARAEVTSDDELGTMARSLNGMLDNTLTLIQSSEERDRIQESIQKLLEEISGVASGDLTQEAEVTAEVTGAIADSFNYMIHELRSVIAAVQETTLQVSSAANEIQTTAEHLATNSEQQTMQIVDTSAAVDEMAISIQQVSANAGQATSVAEAALSNALSGTESVKQTMQGMTSIREQVQETSKRIKRLGESSQEIGEIVQLISDIADRTSILALNASIQAAMAGEAGRGFAVVAEEVERLADRATESTKRISTLIKSIQTDTSEAVTAMEDTTREVVSGSSLANAAGQKLEQIETVSKQLADLIGSISMASKQQARGSESVAKSMTDISEVTQQTAAGAKQAAVSIRNLAELADDLRDSMSRFKLPAQIA